MIKERHCSGSGCSEQNYTVALGRRPTERPKRRRKNIPIHFTEVGT